MRLVAPQRLGLLTRPYMHAGRHWLGITILGGFALERPSELMLATELWALAGEQLAAHSGILDAGIPKARAEVILVGNAHPPIKPATTCPVRVRAGAIDRTLYVIGDRRWENGVPSAPVPFDQMPLTWARAFGGPGYAQNPEGRGIGRALLPNVELPDQLVKSERDCPAPASFGPIDPLWPQRMSGTYDAAWLEHEYPGFPKDLDWGSFNVASREQQIDGAFEGGEPIEIVNMHPVHTRICSSIPTHLARAVVVKRGVHDDVAFKRTTLWLFPEAMRGVVVHHGVVAIEEDDGADVDAIVIGADAPDAPRSMQHFLDVMRTRTDRDRPERALAAILDDSQLLPPGQGSTFGDEIDRDRKASTPELPRYARQWQKARREIDEARASLEAEGLDPDEYGPKALPPSPPPALGLDQIEAFAAEKKEELDALRERAPIEMEEKMRELDEALASVGVDPDERRFEAELAQCGPPTFTAQAKRDEIRASADEHDSEAFEFLREMSDGARFVELYETAEREGKIAYLRGAHLQRAFPSPAKELRAERRERLLSLLRHGVREIDLSCADLSGLDLRGRDLRGAWLESADLSDADLSGACLDGAVLTRATLLRTKLVNASLAGANLGGVEVRGSGLTGADLQGAELMRSSWIETSLVGAKLANQQPFEAELRFCDLSRADLRGAKMIQAKTEGLRLAGADLAGSCWIEVALDGADLSGANMDRAVLYRAPLTDATLDGAKLTNAVLVMGTSLARASLVGADLSNANLRGMDLSRADLEGAVLDGADLGTSNLTGAKLDRVRARGAIAISAVLAGASAEGSDWKDALLSKADLRGADLRDASLFGSDLAWIAGDAATKIDGADTTRARARPQRRQTLPERQHG